MQQVLSQDEVDKFSAQQFGVTSHERRRSVNGPGTSSPVRSVNMSLPNNRDEWKGQFSHWVAFSYLYWTLQLSG